jgi:hypothetical protein
MSLSTPECARVYGSSVVQQARLLSVVHRWGLALAED